MKPPAGRPSSLAPSSAANQNLPKPNSPLVPCTDVCTYNVLRSHRVHEANNRAPYSGDRGFESGSLQRGVACEPEDDIDIPVRRGSTITIRDRAAVLGPDVPAYRRRGPKTSKTPARRASATIFGHWSFSCWMIPTPQAPSTIFFSEHRRVEQPVCEVGGADRIWRTAISTTGRR